MGAVITYQDHAGTNTLNTDIVLKLSADNGSNYSTATLTALPDFATGIKMAKVNDLSVTAGTQLKYKIEFANQASGSKEARIRGIVATILIMIETEDTIRKLDKDVALIKQKLDILENNHLAHIKKDVDRILYILGAVGIVVLGELFVLLNAVL